jgi:hypothetical protein
MRARTLLQYGGILLGVSEFGRPRMAYVYALALSSTICCLVALLQLRGGNPLGLFPGDFTYFDAGYKYSGAFLGTIGNTDVLAAFLCLGIPLFIGAAALSRNRRDVLLLAPAALCLYVLFRSGVSSGMLALGAAALVSAPCLVSARFGRQRLTRIAWAVSAAVAAAGLLAVWFWRGTSGTVYELSQVLHGHMEGAFGSSRILIWRDALGIAGQRPLLGAVRIRSSCARTWASRGMCRRPA